MARPQSLELPATVYLVSARCPPGAVESRLAFAEAPDQARMIELLSQATQRFDAQVLAYALLPGQYQLLLFTRQANLSRLMRHLNGVYTQQHQRHHGGRGALFQGRFRAVLVDRRQHLLDACRHVDLSPVREGLTRSAPDWPASSCAAHVGRVAAQPWLDVDGLRSHLLGRPVRTPAERRDAGQHYLRLLQAEPDFDLWPGRLRDQIFLGDARFAQDMRQRAAKPSLPAQQRRSWGDWLAQSASREQALYRAHTEGGMSMTALAAALGLSVSRVSRLIAAVERQA